MLEVQQWEYLLWQTHSRFTAIKQTGWEGVPPLSGASLLPEQVQWDASWN